MHDLIEIFNNFPEFDLGEYRLRQLTLEDAPEYFLYMNHANVFEYINLYSRVRSLDGARADLSYWINTFNNKQSIYWAIALKENNKLIGTVGFNFIFLLAKKGELSYDLDYAYWGKGIMIKSIKQILKFATDVIKLKRIQATVIKNNKKSIKLLERVGFQKEGILRNFETLDGNLMFDSYMYSIVF